jgi:hypothetical protein
MPLLGDRARCFSLQSPCDTETKKALRRYRLDALPGVSICIACSRTMHLAKEQQHGFRAGVAFRQSGPVSPDDDEV